MIDLADEDSSLNEVTIEYQEIDESTNFVRHFYKITLRGKESTAELLKMAKEYIGGLK